MRNFILEIAEEVRKHNGIVAGGCVADMHFGKDINDIDVFIDYASFQAIYESQKDLFVSACGYGNLDNTSVYTVVRGFQGRKINIDFVVSTNSIVKLDHDELIQGFDSSVKQCYIANGKYVYAPSFQRTVKSGIINPTSAGMIEMEDCLQGSRIIERAQSSANKYGLEVSRLFSLAESV